MINGYQAIVALAAWGALVLIYGLYRSLGDPEQDRIRPSGPLD